MNLYLRCAGTTGALGLVLALAPAAGPPQGGPGTNLVVNGDFENGYSGFTSGYERGDVSAAGSYTIDTNPSNAPGAYGDWCNCGDHTTGKGNMLIVNGATSDSLAVWEESVTVAPSTNYTFSYWAAEVDQDSQSVPHLEAKINGRAVGDFYLPRESPDEGGKWVNSSFAWNSGSSGTADLVIVDLNIGTTANDFALDDISFTGSATGSAPVTK